MKKSPLIVLLFILSFVCATHAAFGESSRIEALIAQMTLEEKAGQLNLVPWEEAINEDHFKLIREGKIGNVLKSNGVVRNRQLQEAAVKESRLGIPILFHEDVIHGYRTITPVPLAEVASWDMEAIRMASEVAAREASAAGIHLTYAPMVDVTRDPRWGRILETAGEDPYLGSEVAAARVKGFQESGDESYQNLLACVKHFAGYGAALAGRDYNIIDFSERELREIYLPPFQAAIDAGVASLMCAYSSYDGVPLTANEFLMKDILRGEMGFEGLTMTDWGTIKNLVFTGIEADLQAATVTAMKTGIDMDMQSRAYVELLPKLVRDGKVSEAMVDDAVRQVLILKEKAGLFDDPYAYFDEARETAELLSVENRSAAKAIAQKSMVLLKNDGATLPLQQKEIKKIAVIGPFAKSKKDLMGWWFSMGDEADMISIYDAIGQQLGDACEISYAQGCEIDKFNEAGAELIPQAREVAADADLVIMVLGEEYWMSGEGGGTASLRLPSLQEELIAEVAKADTPIVSVIISGRPYVLTDVAKHSDALLQAWMPGTMGAEAVVSILTGEFNPCGKLPVTFPIHEGQIPIYYGYKRTSHRFDAGPENDRYTTTYRDVQHEPLYPFGYGLSYTSFEYGDLQLSQTEMQVSGSLKVQVEVKNTGEVAGREIVQLYIGDKVCSVTRPLYELKDFMILELAPGETKLAEFEITSDKLSFIGRDYSPSIEAGKFDVYVGSSSVEKDLKKASFVLNLP